MRKTGLLIDLFQNNRLFSAFEHKSHYLFSLRLFAQKEFKIDCIPIPIICARNVYSGKPNNSVNTKYWSVFRNLSETVMSSDKERPKPPKGTKIAKNGEHI